MRAKVDNQVTVLLTGASGVVGQALLDRLDSPYRPICLVHSAPVQRPDVRTVFGDVTRPQLGLSPAHYRELAAEVDWIVHSAAETGFRAPPGLVDAVNVGGTNRILQLAADASVPLCHLSTAFVDRVLHCDGDVTPRAYEQSKTDAERAVRESGLPAVIIRPSVIIGDSRTGRTAHFQGLFLLARAFLKGLIPVVPANPVSRVDVIPQDVVADVIVRLFERSIRQGDYWLTAGEEAPTLQVLADICAEYSEAIGQPVKPPRFVTQDVFDRLIRPVFIPELPARMRTTIEQILELFVGFSVDRPFPSSLPGLHADLGTLALPTVGTSLRRSLDYWGSMTGTRSAPRSVEDDIAVNALSGCSGPADNREDRCY